MEASLPRKKKHSLLLQTPKHQNIGLVLLPNEITEIILSNLPVKSLLRFKCVSKQWYRFFSSPNYQQSNKRVGTIVAMYNSPRYMQRRWSFRPSFTFINQQQLTMEELDSSPLMKRREFSKLDTKSFRILGSCHGLILINVDVHIYLWNPAIRFCTKVLELYYLAWNSDQFTTLGGLCFDSSKNDYKAILLTYDEGLGGAECVTIASLKGKEWRLLKLPYDIRSIRDGITLHGRLHYRVRNRKEPYVDENNDQEEDDDNNVIYFDPIYEKFHVFPVPEPKSKGRNPIVGLGVLKECLCIARLDYDNKGVEIFVMKEYGAKKSWTSLYFITSLKLSSFNGFEAPFSMTENEELLALEAPFSVTENEELLALRINPYKRKVVVYPKNDNMRDIPLDEETKCICGAITYVESLISPMEYCWSEKRHKKFARRAEQLLPIHLTFYL